MNFNRRMFIGGLAALVGGLAVEEAIPLGRVWSFPSTIAVPQVVNVTLESYADYMSITDLLWPTITRELSLRAYRTIELLTGGNDENRNQ